MKRSGRAREFRQRMAPLLGDCLTLAIKRGD